MAGLRGAGGGHRPFPNRADISVLGYRRCQLASPAGWENNDIAGNLLPFLNRPRYSVLGSNLMK